MRSRKPIVRGADEAVINLLQWGRDLAVTETIVGLLLVVALWGFNGAVTLRSRKRRAVARRHGTATGASMGP